MEQSRDIRDGSAPLLMPLLEGATEDRFRALFEHAPIGLALHSANGKLIHTNRAYQQMVGYTNTELLTLGVRRVTHREDVHQGEERFKELREGHLNRSVRSKRYVHKDGHIVWAQSTVSAVRQPDGALLYILSMIEDISEQVRAKEQTAVFNGLGRALNTARTPHDAAWIILESAREVLGWHASYLHLLTDSGTVEPVLTLDTIDGCTVEVPRVAPEIEPSAVMRHVLSQGSLLINRGSAPNETAPPVPLKRFGDEHRPSASLLYVPIRDGTKAVGIISVQSYTANAYNGASRSILEGLAEHCGAALSRIQAVAALEASERNLRTLIEALPDWVLRFRTDGSLIDSRKPKLFPVPSTSALPPRHLRDLLPLPAVRGILQAAASSAGSAELRTCSVEYMAEGQIRHCEVRVTNSQPGEYLAVIQDVTDARRMAGEIVEISHAERQRIGHELHDGVGQYLAATAFKAKALESLLNEELPSAATEAAELVQLINASIRQVRFACNGLDPIAVQSAGLIGALAKLPAEIESIFNVRCTFRSSSSSLALDSAKSLHLYRTVQEAINNSIRHGQCRTVEISALINGQSLHLSVQDDGAGFSPEKIQPRGLGLRSMSLRIRACGGQLTINSAPGEGTCVECLVPLESVNGLP